MVCLYVINKSTSAKSEQANKDFYICKLKELFIIKVSVSCKFFVCPHEIYFVSIVVKVY